MRVAGLTGGIATGKSTAAALLESHQVPVIDCDKIAKAVVQKARSNSWPALLLYIFRLACLSAKLWLYLTGQVGIPARCASLWH